MGLAVFGLGNYACLALQGIRKCLKIRFRNFLISTVEHLMVIRREQKIAVLLVKNDTNERAERFVSLSPLVGGINAGPDVLAVYLMNIIYAECILKIGRTF